MGGFVPGAVATPTVLDARRDPSGMDAKRVIADVEDKLFWLEGSASPLAAITGGIKKNKRKATQYRVDWLEKDPLPRAVSVNGAVTADAVTVNVATGEGSYIAANSVLQNTRTMEQVSVTSVATDALTVVRGIGGGNAVMNDGDTLIFTRRVFEDGADIGDGKSTKEVDKYNLCEIIRTPIGFTGRQLNTDLYGGKDLNTERRAQAIEHAKSIEYAFLFGKRHSRTGAGGKLQTYMNGIHNVLLTNVWDLGGSVAPTYESFTLFMEYAMRYGDSGNVFGRATKWLFAPPHLLTLIQGWMDKKLEYRPMDRKVGVKVATIQTTHGDLKLVPEPILTDYHSDVAFLLDMKHIRYVYHQGRNTKLLKDRQGNGEDAYEEELFSDVSLEITTEPAHALIKGIPTGV